MFGLRRVPLSVGRVIDLEDDILQVASERLRNTFFTNGELTLSSICSTLWSVPNCKVVLFSPSFEVS